MGVQFTSSADKHGIPYEDSLHAILHAEASAEVEGEPGETSMFYVGHPHKQTDRYIEVIAAHRPPRTIVILTGNPTMDAVMTSAAKASPEPDDAVVGYSPSRGQG